MPPSPYIVSNLIIKAVMREIPMRTFAKFVTLMGYLFSLFPMSEMGNTKLIIIFFLARDKIQQRNEGLFCLDLLFPRYSDGP